MIKQQAKILLDSFSVLPKTDAVALKMTNQTIAYLKEQIAVLEQQMLFITQERCKELYTQISSI